MGCGKMPYEHNQEATVEVRTYLKPMEVFPMRIRPEIKAEAQRIAYLQGKPLQQWIREAVELRIQAEQRAGASRP